MKTYYISIYGWIKEFDSIYSQNYFVSFFGLNLGDVSECLASPKIFLKMA